MNARVLVTGSRDWDNTIAVFANLERALHAYGPITVVHSACPTGTDHMAAMWARVHAHRGVTEEPHPADWHRLGNQAGPARNAHMVSLGATVCLAFINPCTKPGCTRPRPHGSHGASNCAELAEQVGIRVVPFGIGGGR